MNFLKKKAFKFIGISAIGWIIDFIIYSILSIYFALDVGISNFISGIIATTFVFIVSFYKIFKNKDNKIPIQVKYLIYFIYQIVLLFCISWFNIIVNEYILVIFKNVSILNDYSSILSKIIITPITMTINYIVMKKLIERI